VTISERSVWVQLVVMPVTALIYFSVVLTRAADMPVKEVSWVVPLIWAMSAIVGGIILGTIATAIGTYARAEARGVEADLEESDVRDKEIEHLGNRKGQFFTGIGTFAVIILAMARVDHFWIANTMFLAGILAGIHGGLAKLQAYRRGF